MSVDYEALDDAYAADAGTSTAAAPPRLPPYFGREHPSRDIVLAAQKRCLRTWLRESHRFAVVKRKIAERRRAALETET